MSRAGRSDCGSRRRTSASYHFISMFTDACALIDSALTGDFRRQLVAELPGLPPRADVRRGRDRQHRQLDGQHDDRAEPRPAADPSKCR